MNSFKNKFAEFMQGRYGTDKLTAGLFVLYAVIGLLRIFIRGKIGVTVISVLMWAVLVYAVIRVFSKNIYKRQRENAVFCNFLLKITPHLTLLRDRIRDIKTKRYRRCPCCKNVLRLPVKRGKHTVRCPRCGKEFSVHII